MKIKQISLNFQDFIYAVNSKASILENAHLAILLLNKNIKLSSYKSNGNIQKKEDVPDSTVSKNHFSSVTLNELTMNARERERERERAYYTFEFQKRLI